MSAFSDPEFSQHIERWRQSSAGQTSARSAAELLAQDRMEAERQRTMRLLTNAREVARIINGQLQPNLQLRRAVPNTIFKRILSGNREVASDSVTPTWKLVDTMSSQYNVTRGEYSYSGADGLALGMTGRLFTYNVQSIGNIITRDLATPEALTESFSLPGFGSDDFHKPVEHVASHNRAIEFYLAKFVAEKL
ncbi:MAG: hypothetical protein JWO41_444 [Candidatus Saccharibacteria bacterium]|nr:hypothetical protein [Candidatus Saccharibacteria bacterium]